MRAGKAAIIPSVMLLMLPVAAHGQSMQDMPGMKMPTKAKPKAAPKKKAAPAKATVRVPAKPKASPPTDHDMSAVQGMAMGDAAKEGTRADDKQIGAMPGMASMEPQDAGQATGTKPVQGDALPPPPPADHAADRAFSAERMQASRDVLRTEQGGQKFSMVLFNLAEVQIRNGKDGYRWDGEGWYGGDLNRLVIKSEGEGSFMDGVDAAEVQALYSRAIGPFFNVQAGVRHDFQPSPNRTYATIGFEGLAPYFFDVEGALFLSEKGDLLARLEGDYDQRITQRLIVQPRVELNFAAQDVPENRIGAGLSQAELGLRLRYEITREIAPYIGVSYDSKVGRSATFARRAGDDVHATSLVLGIRTWF